MPAPLPLSQIALRFREQLDAEILANFSSIALTPAGYLWLGSDELHPIGAQKLNTIERLSLTDGAFANHQTFCIKDYIDLDDRQGEIDIEGLSYSSSYLWLIGSHSAKRKRIKLERAASDNIQRLAEVKVEPNRYLLARIPERNGELFKSCADPQQPDRTLTAACLQRTASGNLLMEALKHDPHLKRFLKTALPSKENGFDIEGLAVHGNRLFLGLRGPVLGEWAILLEIEVRESKPGLLALKPLSKKGPLYRKYFLKLGGLGIRELCWWREQLLILAGPTMDLPGIISVFCLKDILTYQGEGLFEPGLQLRKLFDLPYSAEGDKAEGIDLLPAPACADDQADHLLIIHDSPRQERLVQSNSLLADVLRLEDAKSP